MAWHPVEADLRAFVAKCLEVHDITNERVFRIQISVKKITAHGKIYMDI